MSMKLNAFSVRDVQTFLTLIELAEADGLSDIGLLQEHLQTHLRLSLPPAGTNNHLLTITCPECGQPMARSIVDGLRLLTCKSCRYSQIIGDK